MKRLSRAVVALVMALGLGAPSAWAATPADTMVIAKFIDDIITLDPAEVFELSGGEVIANVYDRIMMHEPEKVEELVGGVVEGWKVSQDGGTLTFKMRPGLKFHSGNPVTAHDAAFSLQRVIKLKKTPSFILTQFGFTAENVDQRIKAISDSEFSFSIDKAYAPSFVLNCLSAGVASVVDRKEALAHEKDGDLGYNWLKTNSAGSGAYRVRSWTANESVVLEANPGYRHGAPKVKRVIIRHVPEASAQRLLLEKGDADMARNLGPDQIAGLSGNKDIRIETNRKADNYYMGLNQKHPILSKPKVRQALRWLVDYEGLAKTVLRGQFSVHQSFWPSGMFASFTENPFHLDVARAKKLLTEAGHPDGFSFTLQTNNTAPFPEIAQSIQATMAKAGVKAELVTADARQTITKYRARAHEAVLLYWSPDYMDPHANADAFASNPDNRDEAKLTGLLTWRNSWQVPELNRKVQAAVLERDTAKRKQMYLELQRETQADGAFVFMFQLIEQTAVRANLKRFVSGPTFDTVFYRLVTK